MKTLLKQPCPNCGEYKFYKTDYDEATCRSCWTTSFIGRIPDLDKPVRKRDFVRKIKVEA